MFEKVLAIQASGWLLTATLATGVSWAAPRETSRPLPIRESGDIIWSGKPASEWSEGYAVGNGRIGGMVLGNASHERIALNHDLLWRQFWRYQPRHTSGDIKEIRALNLSGAWDEGDALALKKIPFTGNAIYVNPYVPAGDLYISMKHSAKRLTDYRRTLNMAQGITDVSYRADNNLYRRETFASWKHGLLITHLTGDRAGTLSGEVSLSRLLDPECVVSGYATLDKIVLKGVFEEGREFAVVARVVQRGGRLTGGRKTLVHSPENLPERNFGLKYIFSTNEMFGKGDGASACFDSADEVWILVSITVDEELKDGEDLVKKCLEKIERAGSDYASVKTAHIADFKSIYHRVSVDFGTAPPAVATDSLLLSSVNAESLSPALLEKMFNLSRYLSISSGRPQAWGEPAKAPINLQGIWNQDRRPAWDCDYHLDLNLEMCYWPQNMLNLGEWMIPLMDWAERLKEKGKVAARDMYGCEGLVFGVVADYHHIGNVDNFAFFWTGGAAWVAQVLWQHWQYTRDFQFLGNRLYPFLREVGRFYEGFLVEDRNGSLVPALSASPEMAIAGRKGISFSSSASTMDLELIRDVFTHLIEAGNLLKAPSAQVRKWEDILKRVPMPRIEEDGSLAEWLEDHPMADPGHRHRSLLVGLCPGERISVDKTEEYAAAAYKAIQKRNEHGRKMTQSLTFVWDAQMLARLSKGQEALDELKRMLPVHVLENLLITCNDWSGAKGGLAWFKDVKLFQIEANIAVGAAIIEMVFQDGQETLKFIPALPAELPEGKVSGLRARGGFEVGLEWKDHLLKSAGIRSLEGSVCRIRKSGFHTLKIESSGKEIRYREEGGDIIFNTSKGASYRLTCD